MALSDILGQAMNGLGTASSLVALYESSKKILDGSKSEKILTVGSYI